MAALREAARTRSAVCGILASMTKYPWETGPVSAGANDPLPDSIEGLTQHISDLEGEIAALRAATPPGVEDAAIELDLDQAFKGAKAATGPIDARIVELMKARMKLARLSPPKEEAE
jgi:hypothetical protein